MCHEFADCRNKLGSYECDCRDGFHGDGFSCSGEIKLVSVATQVVLIS